MIKHQIFLAEDYSSPCGRIALDLINPTAEELTEVTTQLSDRLPDLSYSTHCLYTSDARFESVQDHDAYFNNVEKVPSLNDFVCRLKNSTQVTAAKVAIVIKELANNCDPLKLQKLLYLCQAEYLLQAGDELYPDKIEAWKYGPVVRSVYYSYQKYERSPIPKTGLNESVLVRLFASSPQGMEKFNSIKNTIGKYGALSGSELVNLTHRENSPWAQTKRNQPITLESIKSGHSFETL